MKALFNHKSKHTRLYLAIILCFIVSFYSCRKFVQNQIPEKELSVTTVFSNERSATAAVLGVYYDLWDVGYDMALATGLSADEFMNHSSSTTNVQLYENEINSSNAIVATLWKKYYKCIYDANASIEGLNNSPLTEQSSKQLMGEVRFLRAFSYFNLVNLFGDVPLITSTDYRINSKLGRTSSDSVYSFILNELQLAKDALSTDYLANERIRVNRSAATALLARIYLYRNEWEKAELSSTEVISDINYGLEALPNVFLANNNEAILQFYPISDFTNTSEGYNFILQQAPAYNISIRSEFLNSFENQDQRRLEWFAEVHDNNGNYFYFPFKYKIQYGSVKSEYAVVLRLVEQYLIRAEVRAQKGVLTGANSALSDINVIRSRAGLDQLQGLSKEQLIDAIIDERRHELFSEWGHRWFDLKRTGRINEALTPLKLKWQTFDQLYPIPAREISINSMLIQNNGY